jgi:hypothetical protein
MIFVISISVDNKSEIVTKMNRLSKKERENCLSDMADDDEVKRRKLDMRRKLSLHQNAIKPPSST